jgi:putative inorganic carbon (hco3(-)) transporter
VRTFQKIIFVLFAILLFLVPLILWPFTSEVFEFNKMVLVYILTTLITGTWLISMILEKKIIFRRTILDIPLLVFIGSQFISTILSIDPLTSWLGYYSRFNGGLVSTACYALLYWALVSNIDAKRTMKLVYVMLGSAVLVSIYGVLEHFGIDKSIWVQDVQSRVFSTLGQPNWLAAWLIALTPITWYLVLDTGVKPKNYKFWVYLALSVLFFWTMIFTKSRSGYLGFAVASVIFWALTAWQKRSEIKTLFLPLILVGASIFIICLISGTEWTPSIGSLIHKSTNVQVQVAQAGATALETGGTESSTIRKIVWTGAIQIWLHYPVFGTGVETFAYSYYLYRPAEHNLTSEWDFIYNKAHNEYLNFLANSGAVGLISYLIVVGFSIYIFVKNRENLLVMGLFAGYVSLLVTNFFGFSVVPTQLELFLFPAIVIAIANNQQPTDNKQLKKLSSFQKISMLVVVSCGLIVVFACGKYWYADTLFAMGSNYNKAGKPDVATEYLTQAVNLEPYQPLYYGDSYGFASAYASLAVALNQQKQTDQATELTNMAIAEINKAVTLSPANINFKRTEFGIYIMLSTINPNYLINARDTLIAAIAQAPTDAKLYYNLGLTYARIGQTDQALSTLKKTVELKANYKDARLALAILLIDEKRNAEAKTQLNYILTNIDPNDSLTKQTLAGIK